MFHERMRQRCVCSYLRRREWGRLRLTVMKAPIRLFFHRRRSEFLLCGFLAELLATPLADRDRRVGGLMAVFLVVLFSLCARDMASRKAVKLVVIPIAAVWLLTRLLEAFGNTHDVFTHVSPIAGFALSCAVLWAFFDHFDTVPRVTSSVISEAFITYVVIAIAFAQLYWIGNDLIPNAFNQVIPRTEISTLEYFSMVTLGGVGYGGIIPVNPYVRLVCALENMIGIFYIAVVVARLISSYKPKHRGVAPVPDASKSEE
jgi:Ion channel